MASSSDRTEVSSRRVKALLLSPIIVLFASAARLLIISNYDTTTATTIAASSGVVGTLLGTIIPLLPLFLPAILIFFVIFRRWGLVILTALFTALVSPATIHSAGDGLRVATDTVRSVKGVWHGALHIWPAIGEFVTRVVHTGAAWIRTILDWAIWAVFGIPLGLLGLDNHKLLSMLDGWRRNVLKIWDSWDSPVQIAAVCALAAFLWVIYAPPWNLFPRGGLFRKTRAMLKEWSLIRLSSTAVRILGITAYGLGVAAICGFSVLYIERVYDVPLKRDIVFEILRRPWLPTEKLTLSSGNTLVGYTISISIGWHVFLDEKTRTIHYLHTSEVTNRVVCHLNKEAKSSKQVQPNTPFISPGHIEPGKVDSCF